MRYPGESHGIPTSGIELAQYEKFMSIPYEAIVVLDVIKFYGETSLDTILTFFPCNGIDTDTTIIDYIKMLFKIGLIEFVKIERVQKKIKSGGINYLGETDVGHAEMMISK